MPPADDWARYNQESLASALAWLKRRLNDPTEDALIVPADSALGVLCERLRLSPFESSTLLLCVGVELDVGLGELLASLADGPGKPYPTFALALRRFADGAWDALAPQGPLRYWRLLDVDRQPAEPLLLAALTADERIVHFVKGLRGVDERLLPYLSPPPAAPARLSESQSRLAAEIARLAPGLSTFVLLGPATECRGAARAACDQLELPLVTLHPDALPQATMEWEPLLRLWRRELLLAPAALCLHASDLEPSHAAVVRRFLRECRVPIFVVGAPRFSLDIEAATLAVEKPTAAEQAKRWSEVAGASAAAIAERMHLGFDAIEEIAATAGENLDDLWKTCQLRSLPAFGRMATCSEPRARWDDLVLPAAQTAQLRALVVEFRHRRTVLDNWGFRAQSERGLGTLALFIGESGSGKTLAAEVVAAELGLRLARIDLSSIVDKYIGETEKNLARVFDAAEDGGALLFFDEADALFGKRAEVKDSHDRYANIEIDYLLQRMDDFRGIAILATNLKGSLDSAFARRLRCTVAFPFPGWPERRAIWERVLPAATPRGSLDFDFLARMPLTGGNIRSIALGAAFRAAEARSAVTMPLLLEAARLELTRLGRPIHEADLAWPATARG